MLKFIVLFLLAMPAWASPSSARFWVWDLTVMPPGFRQAQFTHGGEAPLNQDRLQVWIEDGIGAAAPTETQLRELVPIYAKAIDLQRSIFGNQPTPPGGDRDFHALIAAIPPYENNGKTFGFDGFFNIFDQLTEADAQKQDQHSNEKNIIYVNALHDVNSDYMRAVVIHELNHLITHGQYDAEANPLDGWLNEMLGEAAMEMSGYFTDVSHVNAYRAHPEWPLAVEQFGISYGGLSLLAEYLMREFDPALMGRIAPARGNGFERLTSVYGRSWNALFEGYVRWLFEQDPPSSFPGSPVAVRQPTDSLRLGPTGVSFLPENFDHEKLSITAVPKGCERSRNVLRTSVVRRAAASLTSKAVWVESDPPCAANRGQTKFDAFVLQ